MNGLEFLAVVKQLRPDIRVLMISGHANEALIARAFDAGASDFISKPFDRDRFVSAVRHGLELSRSIDSRKGGEQAVFILAIGSPLVESSSTAISKPS